MKVVGCDDFAPIYAGRKKEPPLSKTEAGMLRPVKSKGRSDSTWSQAPYERRIKKYTVVVPANGGGGALEA